MTKEVTLRQAGGSVSATLPKDASLLERYAYQFYVKPLDADLKGLLRELPAADRAQWVGDAAGL